MVTPLTCFSSLLRYGLRNVVQLRGVRWVIHRVLAATYHRRLQARTVQRGAAVFRVNLPGDEARFPALDRDVMGVIPTTDRQRSRRVRMRSTDDVKRYSARVPVQTRSAQRLRDTPASVKEEVLC